MLAVAAASTPPYDDTIATLAEETGLDVHFAHGRPALHTADGQTAAPLADILLLGLTQEQVRRLIARLNPTSSPRKEPPADWHHMLTADATLSKLSKLSKLSTLSTLSKPERRNAGNWR